jgi:hypothetical protein
MYNLDTSPKNLDLVWSLSTGRQVLSRYEAKAGSGKRGIKDRTLLPGLTQPGVKA